MGYPTWVGIRLGYGMGKAPLDTIPFNRNGSGFSWDICGIILICSGESSHLSSLQ